MPFEKAKIYFGESHFTAILQENYKQGKGNKHTNTAIATPRQVEILSKFETAYTESQSLPSIAENVSFIIDIILLLRKFFKL